VLATQDACCKVVPRKVSSGDRDKFDRDFLRDELFTALTSMWNGKYPRLDGLPYEFYKAM
jgi:hypothetical protein